MALINFRALLGVKKKKKELTLNEVLNLIFGKTRGEINTSEDAFNKNSWVYACVRAIAETISSAPLKIVNSKNESVEKIEAYFKKPNPNMTGVELREGTFAWMELRGVAYWLIQKPFIYLLDSDMVQIKREEGEIKEVRYYVGNSKWEVYDPEDVVIFKNFNPYVRTLGFSTITAAMKAAQMQGLADETNINTLKNGALIPGFLKANEEISEASIERIKKQWGARYSGFENAGKTPFIPADVSYEKIGLTPQDMQFLQMEKMTTDRISTVFGVPALFLNRLENVNWATAKEQRRVFWEFTLIPKLRRFEERLNVFVLPKFGSGLRAYFDLSQVEALKENESEKVKRDQIQITTGLRTINELRERDGLPPVPWGNSWWGNLSMVPLGEYKPEKEVDPFERLIKEVSIRVQKDNKERIWKLFVSKITPQEEKLAKEVSKLFKKQEKEVLEKIKNNIVDFGKEFKDEFIDRLLFDFDEWVDVFQKKEMPYLVAFMKQGGDETLTRYSLDINFDVYNYRVQEWLKKKTFKFAKEVNETTQRHLREQLIEGWKNGEGIEDLSKRVKKVFDFATKSRAKTIARTEIVSANNKASVEAIRQAGGKWKKVWLTALDERTREWHAEADGQKVDLDQPFIVNGEALDYPGDPNGSPENIINCRCTVIYEPA